MIINITFALHASLRSPVPAFDFSHHSARARLRKQGVHTYEIPSLITDMLDLMPSCPSVHEIYWDTKMVAEALVSQPVGAIVGLERVRNLSDATATWLGIASPGACGVLAMSPAREPEQCGARSTTESCEHQPSEMVQSDSDAEMQPQESFTSQRGRSQSPCRETDWIMMLEAEPRLGKDEQLAVTQSSAWAGEPKPFGKPERFAGDEKRWTQWRFGMKAYLSLCGVMAEQALDGVARRNDPVIFAEIPHEFREESKLLFYMLASSCTGRAQCFVRTAENQNGLEAWRLLNQRYHRQNADSTFALLRVLVNFTCGHDVRGIEGKLAEFDSLVQEYEERATEVLSDEVIRGILTHAVPDPLKSHLRVCSSTFSSAHDARRAIAESPRPRPRRTLSSCSRAT